MDIKMMLLNNEIEYLRESLQLLLIHNSPTSPQVIECSQDLDKLLLEYEKYKYLHSNDGLKTA